VLEQLIQFTSALNICDNKFVPKVFNKIKARLGGRVRLMSSGASPLSADVMEFLRM